MTMTSTPDPEPGATFVVEGIIVAGRTGQVRVLLDQAVLDLDESDVVSMTELPSETHLIERLARPVRLELRRGARLLHVSDADAYDDVIWRRGRLFAMRTRRNEPAWRTGDGYARLEREFFARYGIERPEPKEHS
jgi:hypothetical protein